MQHIVQAWETYLPHAIARIGPVDVDLLRLAELADGVHDALALVRAGGAIVAADRAISCVNGDGEEASRNAVKSLAKACIVGDSGALGGRGDH